MSQAISAAQSQAVSGIRSEVHLEPDTALENSIATTIETLKDQLPRGLSAAMAKTELLKFKTDSGYDFRAIWSADRLAVAHLGNAGVELGQNSAPLSLILASLPAGAGAQLAELAGGECDNMTLPDSMAGDPARAAALPILKAMKGLKHVSLAADTGKGEIDLRALQCPNVTLRVTGSDPVVFRANAWVTVNVVDDAGKKIDPALLVRLPAVDQQPDLPRMGTVALLTSDHLMASRNLKMPAFSQGGTALGDVAKLQNPAAERPVAGPAAGLRQSDPPAKPAGRIAGFKRWVRSLFGSARTAPPVPLAKPVPAGKAQLAVVATVPAAAGRPAELEKWVIRPVISHGAVRPAQLNMQVWQKYDEVAQDPDWCAAIGEAAAESYNTEPLEGLIAGRAFVESGSKSDFKKLMEELVGGDEDQGDKCNIGQVQMAKLNDICKEIESHGFSGEVADKARTEVSKALGKVWDTMQDAVTKRLVFDKSIYTVPTRGSEKIRS